MMSDAYPDFLKEFGFLSAKSNNALQSILLNKDRITKHKPWSWQEESQDEHLRKAIRHILTYQLIRDKQQKDTGENHLNNALVRLIMGLIND